MMIKFVKQNILILIIPILVVLIIFNNISIAFSDILFNNNIVNEQVSIIDLIYKFFCIPVNLSDNYNYISEFYNYNLLDKSRLIIMYIPCIAILIRKQSMYMNKKRYFIFHRYKTIKNLLLNTIFNNIFLLTIYLLIMKLTIIFSFILDGNLLNKNLLNSNYFNVSIDFFDLIISLVYLSFKELMILFTIWFLSLIIIYIYIMILYVLL